MRDTDQRHPEVARMYRYFDFGHLPPHLRAVSEQFAALADVLLTMLPDSPELTAALRKLLESKDCAVRAAVDLSRQES